MYLRLTITFVLISTFIGAQVNSKSSYNWPEKYTPSRSAFFVSNSIEVAATPEKVWNILINAIEWEQWYSGARDLVLSGNHDSTLQPGTSFQWRTMGLRFTSHVKEYIPAKRLAWESVKPSIQGYHIWDIIPTTTGCTIITEEAQNGRLTFFERIFQPRKLSRLHDEWLLNLKTRAEQIK